MKRIAWLCGVLLWLLAGCASVPEIEDYTWTMTSVQNAAESGRVVASGVRVSGTPETAPQIELLCRAGDGSITLDDVTNRQQYVGTYTRIETSPRAFIYKVGFGEEEGMAVAAMTDYADGSSKPTLILSLAGYAIHFFAE